MTKVLLLATAAVAGSHVPVAASTTQPQLFHLLAHLTSGSALDDLEVQVTASGAIHGSGTGQWDGSAHEFSFPERGTVRVEFTSEEMIEYRPGDSCMLRVPSAGSYRIVGGTGEFVGAGGLGRYEARIVFARQPYPPRGCYISDGELVLTVEMRGETDLG